MLVRRFGGDTMGHAQQVRGIAFAPDGRSLASFGNDRTLIVWDVESAQARVTLDLERVNVGPLAWVEDGIFAAGVEGPVRIVGDVAEDVAIAGLDEPRWIRDFLGSGTTLVWANDEDPRPDGPASIHAIDLPARRATRLAVPQPGAARRSRVINAAAISGDGRTVVAIVTDVERSGNTIAARGRALVTWRLDSPDAPHVAAIPAELGFLGNDTSWHSFKFDVSPDGRFAASAWGEPVIFSTATGAVVRRLPLPMEPLAGDPHASVGCFADGGRAFVAASRTGLVRFDLDDGSVARVVRFRKTCFPLAIDVSARAVALVDDANIALFDLDTLEPLHAPSGHTNAVQNVAIDPRGRIVASADGQTVKAWRAESGELAWTRALSAWGSLAFSPDAAKILATANMRPAFLSPQTGETLFSAEGSYATSIFRDDGSIVHVHYDESQREGETLVVADIRVADGEEATLRVKLDEDYLRCLPLLSQNGSIALFWNDSTLCAWNLDEPKRLWGADHELVAATLSPDGAFAAMTTIAGGEFVTILDMRDGSIAARLAHEGGDLYYGLAWSSADVLAVAGAAGSIRVYALDRAAFQRGDLRVAPRVFSGAHRGLVQSLGFSRDGALLASGSTDGSVALWRVTSP